MASRGVVRHFDDEHGWGVIESVEAPGGCFVHFSALDDFEPPTVGSVVHFDFEETGIAAHHGFAYAATAVRLP